MEKKSFIKLVLGVVGGLLFSLGMCMCLQKHYTAYLLLWCLALACVW